MSDEARRVRFVRDGDEHREERMIQGQDGSVAVEEVTRGPLTNDVYDQDTHAHRLVVSAEGIDVFSRVLSGDSRGTSLEGALKRFFSKDDTFLADLMDLLDLCGVPYSYTGSLGEGVIAFRPQGADGGQS